MKHFSIFRSIIFVILSVFLVSSPINGFEKTEVHTIQIDISTPDGTSIQFPISMNGNNFETEIGFISHGVTLIEVSGLSETDELLYHGSWEGHIYDSQPTNIIIHMIDQEEKETFNGEIPPFIKSIYINPSSVEPGNLIFISVESEDLNVDETSQLSYEIVGLDKNTGCEDCYGDITILEHDGSNFGFSYYVQNNETDSQRDFSVIVSDQKGLSSSIDGTFFINRQSNINTGIDLNSHPEIVNMNVSNSYLYNENPTSTLIVDIQDLDQDIIQYQWTVSKVDGYGSCSVDDITGEIVGILTPLEDETIRTLSLEFHPLEEELLLPRTCQFDLSLTDSKGARVDGRVFIKTGPEPVNHNPIILYTYQNAMKAPEGHKILFMVMAKDIDGDDITFQWDSLYDVGTLEQSNEIKRNHLGSIPFQTSSTNYLTATGNSGVVRCSIIDSEGSTIEHEFTIEENTVFEGNRRLGISETNTYPININVDDGKLKISNSNTNSNTDTNTELTEVGEDTQQTISIQYEQNPILTIMVVILGLFILVVVGAVIYLYKTHIDNEQRINTTRNGINMDIELNQYPLQRRRPQASKNRMAFRQNPISKYNVGVRLKPSNFATKNQTLKILEKVIPKNRNRLTPINGRY